METSALKFSTIADVENWINVKPRSWAVIISARAALRIFPLAASEIDRRPQSLELFELDILEMLRTLCVSWVAARYPSRAAELFAKSAPPFVQGHSTIAKSVGADAANNAFRSALNAVAAARAEADVVTAFATVSRQYAVAGIRASIAAFIDADGLAATGNDAVVANSILAAISADARALEQYENEEKAGEQFAERNLWPDSTPTWVTDSWVRLNNALLLMSPDWGVWIKWYRARLEGRYPMRALEVARATIPGDIWREGPRAVNERIKKIEEQYRRPKEGQKRSSSSRVTSDLQPLDNIPSPFAFQVLSTGKITLAASSANWPAFPQPASKQDHANRLAVSRMLAQDLLADLNGGKIKLQIHASDFAAGFEKYVSRLPTGTDGGNIMLADAEARILRHLFQADVEILPAPFAARLKTILEQHIGLRAFYPELAELYRSVQSGRIDAPLPLDAVEAFKQGVREYTPDVFDPSVPQAIESSAGPVSTLAVSSVDDRPLVDPNQPMPPPDPLGEIDPQKAGAVMTAGAMNSLWKALSEAKKISDAVVSVKKAYDALSSPVAKILEWLQGSPGAGGGGGPIG